MSAWFRHNASAFVEALRQIRRAKTSFIWNVLVIAIALALPFAGLTLADNLQGIRMQGTVEPSVSVFLNADLPRQTAQSLASTLTKIVRQYSASANLSFVSRENALTALQKTSGVANTVAALGVNPLPDAYVVTLETLSTPAAAVNIDQMIGQLAAVPGVEHVQVDAAWVKRLAAMIDVLRVAIILLASTLALVVLVVAFNTIRLQVLTQHAEIRVARLVGATNEFIYRPFYYFGAILGASAGAIALGAVALAWRLLNESIAKFSQLYASNFQLTVLTWEQSSVLLVASAALGLIGSALSIRQHLIKQVV